MNTFKHNRRCSIPRLAENFIVILNWVDLISLGGLLLALSSIPLMVSKQFDLSISALLLAMSIDFLDGPLARKYGLTRDFGRYFDGFIDFIDYLIAPTMFLYLQGFDTLIYMIVLFAFVASGVIRLSVFNEIGNIKTNAGASAYLGMPVFWSLFLIAVFQFLTWYTDKNLIFPVIATLLTAYAFLMVYRASFFKFQDWRGVCAFTLMVALAFAVHARSVANHSGAS